MTLTKTEGCGRGRWASSGPEAIRKRSRVAHQLAQLVGQLFDDHAEALELLEHADQVLAGEAADHLQVFVEGGERLRNTAPPHAS